MLNLLSALLTSASIAQTPIAAPASVAPAPPTAAAARQADVSSPEALVRALYGVISGPAGSDRDWARFRSLFVADAILASAKIDVATGKQVVVARSVDGYVARNAPYFHDHGFFERELVQDVYRVGRIAHVFSSYESRTSSKDAKPSERGINSIEIASDGRRWWIVSILWTQETPGQPLPVQFLK